MIHIGLKKNGKQPDSVCANCQKRFPCGDLDPVDDYWERIEPGTEAPSGQCPECGALCFLEQDALRAHRVKIVIEVKDGMVRGVYSNDIAADVIIADWDVQTDEELESLESAMREAEKLVCVDAE